MNRYITSFLILFLSISLGIVRAQINTGHSPSAEATQKIVVKLKSTAESNARTVKSSTQQILDSLSSSGQLRLLFRNTTSNARTARTSSLIDNIYELTVPGNRAEEILKYLNTNPDVQYAERKPEIELLYVPDDPYAKPSGGSQPYLGIIRAYQAWDVEKSDESMVIGIVDTGIQLDHPDLKDKIALNTDDPINGLDDDGDEYVDNYYGWDIGDSDNDPTAILNHHGNMVAGLAAANTDDGTGIAGVGFNTMFLPVKIFNNNSQTLVNGYEGIVYAVNQGCKIVNLSWGGTGYSQYGQDIINWAVLEKDVVVIAAAGNINEELQYYPASFDNCLSVGATDNTDSKASWATYSYSIDLMAPGHQIFSAYNNSGYFKSNGSSFSTPQVAGVAALVRKVFPHFSAIQVMEQIRVTTDDIYEIGPNSGYMGKLGKGRLNAYSAVTDSLTPSIRIIDLSVKSNHGSLVFPGDTISVSYTFTNYLHDVKNLDFNLSSNVNGVTLSNHERTFSLVASGDTINTGDVPLKLVVDETIPRGTIIPIRLSMDAPGYADFQYFFIQVAPDFFDFATDSMELTVGGNSEMSYQTEAFNKGVGLRFNGIGSGTFGGFLFSPEEDVVLDNVVNNFDMYTRESDFETEKLINLSPYNEDVNIGHSSFTNADYPQLTFEQRVLTNKAVGGENYIIIEYRISNTGADTIKTAKSGLFFDFDLGNYQQNKATWSATGEFGYIHDDASSYFGAIAPLVVADKNFRGIDLDTVSNNTPDLDSLFADTTKYNFMENVENKMLAGELGSGNNVAMMVTYDSLIIPAGGDVKVAWAISLGGSLNSIGTAIQNARDFYNDYREHPLITHSFNICPGDSAHITYDEYGSFEIFDDPYGTTRLDSAFVKNFGPFLNDTTLYVRFIDAGFKTDIYSQLIDARHIIADFAVVDTLKIPTLEDNKLTLVDKSNEAALWQWNFKNGETSTRQNPVAQFDTSGTYFISLHVSNKTGCDADTIKKLVVVDRAAQPSFSDRIICRMESISVTDPNLSKINVYSDATAQQLVYSGPSFQSGSLSTDTTFYITNASELHESLPDKLFVKVSSPTPHFNWQLDTLDLSAANKLVLINQSQFEESIEWREGNTILGTDDTLYYFYPETSVGISLATYDSMLCMATTSHDFTPQSSLKPAPIDTVICPYNDFNYSSSNDILYFYTDEALSHLVKKGRWLSIQNIMKDTVIYMVNMTSLAPSESAAIEISIDPIQANIDVSANEIDLDIENQIVLKNASLGAASHFWIKEGNSINFADSIIVNFTLPDTITYTLVAESAIGCKDTTEALIRAYLITSLQPAERSMIRIYPNPASDFINIENASDLSGLQVSIFNLQGQMVFDHAMEKMSGLWSIPVGNLPKGAYTIVAKNDERQQVFKIIITK